MKKNAPIKNAAIAFKNLLVGKQNSVTKIRAIQYLKYFVMTANLDFLDILAKAVG